MKYPFMTMPDETEITHSSIFEENGVEKIRVYIERPVEGGFIDATCILPDYSWQNNGFSDAEIKEFQDILEKGSHVIYKFCPPRWFWKCRKFLVLVLMWYISGLMKVNQKSLCMFM